MFPDMLRGALPFTAKKMTAFLRVMLSLKEVLEELTCLVVIMKLLLKA